MISSVVRNSAGNILKTAAFSTSARLANNLPIVSLSLTDLMSTRFGAPRKVKDETPSALEAAVMKARAAGDIKKSQQIQRLFMSKAGPSDGELALNLGRWSAQNHDYVHALPALQFAFSSGKMHRDGDFQSLGYAQLKAYQFDNAANLLEKAFSSKCPNPILLNERGNAFILKATVEKNKSEFRSLIDRGLFLYEAALKLDSKSEATRQNLETAKILLPIETFFRSGPEYGDVVAALPKLDSNTATALKSAVRTALVANSEDEIWIDGLKMLMPFENEFNLSLVKKLDKI